MLDIENGIKGLNNWSRCIFGTCDDGFNICLLYDKPLHRIDEISFCSDCKYCIGFSEGRQILIREFLSRIN